MSAPDPEATTNYSRARPADRTVEQDQEATSEGVRAGRERLAVATVAGVAALLLVVAEFLPLIDIVVGSLATVQETVRGGPNHAYTLGVLGTLGTLMTLAAARGSRPAAGALAVIGLAALIIAFGVDLPDTRATGSLPQSIAYEDARAQPAVGFYVESIAAAALLAAGGALLVLSGRERPRAAAGPEAH
ncbi:MAG TPA: hypothetical protein VGW11_12955 [Solirubrobacteraceae bacterium]|nr:hypothetical protein [Solirubrobacteraceae bacterium]